MSLNKPDRLIINSPYEEPKHYWKYDRETRTFDKADGRRPAGYLVASSDSKAFDDPGRFVEIPLVNKIRPRIAEWRKAGYPGATSVTKRLLEHWNNPEERDYRRFFFCQLEAIETLIWLAEAPAADRVGIHIVSDGGSFQRLCSKLATGTGKTVVMAMLIAWQFINKASFPQDKRYSKNVFIVAPNLTVRNRLQVLNPGASDNYYEAFNIIPTGMIEKLRLGKVLIRNWHILQWETEEKLSKKKSVDKRGPKSDEAYVREILQDMSTARNILVINDEAHHAWRIAPGAQVKGLPKEDIEEATKWIGGLDRIQNARGILKCYDFSATPFVPSGKKASEEALFDWIVSDFGLNDAIESGLVKTPRVVIRDDTVPDTESYKSRLYHIYSDEEVKDDLNRKATPESPLPSLVVNAYHLLGADWLETYKLWMEAGHKAPPVMISVANRTETAARIKYSFDHHNVPIDDLCDPGATLHIDSKVLAMAESEDLGELGNEVDQEEDNGEETKKLTKKQQAELLRQQVDTVGQPGQPGGKIRNVISVGMLSEGWDAKTVTHIMGLRAFSSQLLCEQVVGRGLRRTAYDINSEGLFDPEHVNIFGVPFTFLPHEDTGDSLPPPPPPKTRIEPVSDKQEFEITFPNVIRIEHVFRPQLSLDMPAIAVLELDASNTIKLADLAAVVEGKPDIQTITSIDLEKRAAEYRLQKVMFEVTKRVYEQMSPAWKGSKENLLGQLFKLVDDFLKSDKIVILPESYNQNSLKRRLVLALNMATVVNHIWGSIQDSNTTVLTPVFDQDHPIKSTRDMNPWYTGKPNEYTVKSHINYCVFDSAWESCEAFHLDCNNGVTAWVKNDHLGFEIYYVWQGVVRKYRPDFIIRLVNDLNLVLEVKGQETEQDKTKRRFMEEWVKAVNNHGGFSEWAFAVSRDPGDVEGIIGKYSNRGAFEITESEDMNDDMKVLKHFLEIPIGSSDGVFERFRQIPNADFRGEKQKRFLYVRGFRQNKVLLVAHADTVWDKNYEKPFTSKHEVIFHNGIVTSGTEGCGIGADDRAGCAILWLLKDMGHSLLITDGEEHGLKGSSWLMKDPENSDMANEINSEHQFVIQLDRCNGLEFKCYEVGTREFKSYVEKITHYRDVGGDRFTDICQLCKSITGVNLSIGYHNEHHSNESLALSEWKNTLELCRTWLGREDLPRYILT